MGRKGGREVGWQRDERTRKMIFRRRKERERERDRGKQRNVVRPSEPGREDDIVVVTLAHSPAANSASLVIPLSDWRSLSSSSVSIANDDDGEREREGQSEKR